MSLWVGSKVSKVQAKSSVCLSHSPFLPSLPADQDAALSYCSSAMHSSCHAPHSDNNRLNL